MRKASRIRWPGLLLIGAAAKNLGKTTRCTEALSMVNGAFALKVAVDHERSRWTAGDAKLCLEGEGFALHQEVQIGQGRDTSRMLQAGAQAVFLLHIKPETLPDAFHGLRSWLGERFTRPWVVESTRLAQIVEPDLFLLLVKGAPVDWKGSARRAQPFADHLIERGSPRLHQWIKWDQGAWSERSARPNQNDA